MNRGQMNRGQSKFTLTPFEKIDERKALWQGSQEWTWEVSLTMSLNEGIIGMPAFLQKTITDFIGIALNNPRISTMWRYMPMC
jgi:hypothetical protein